MSILEKIVFIMGLLIILFPPVLFAFIEQSYMFLALYVVLLIAWKIGLRMLYCKKCINFACPFNAVNDETRNAFFEKNSVVKNAWEK
jgi:hypothetical protein